MLHTTRLALRPFTPDDAGRLASLYTDPAVMAIRRLGVLDEAASAAQLTAIVDHWRACGFGLFAVFERDGDRFVGECGLRHLEERGAVELAYGFRPGAQGKGYATEASLAVISHAFADLRLPGLLARSRGDNLASHRVLEKCGMRLLRRELRGPHGVVEYGIRRPPFATRTVTAWRSAYPEPLRLRPGELVTTGRRDDEFPGWIWTVDGHGRAGWAPSAVLAIDTGTARVQRAYDATELDVAAATPLQVLELLGGWAWVEAPHQGQGWVPQDCLCPDDLEYGLANPPA